ncbi:MAG TPA: rhodanese-related sulfurtransferase [Chthoniobacterales bacterium]|nr:rhodanese-related sulfurtransferase [Chthoniobacterales bacterium]
MVRQPVKAQKRRFIWNGLLPPRAGNEGFTPDLGARAPYRKVHPDMSEAFPVILFYKYVAVADPAEFAAAQRELCVELGLKGRVLIATEGINGTLAGPRASIDQYMDALKRDARFSDITFKLSAGDAGTFPKLVVKVRKEIVTLNAGDLAPDRDNQLSPAAWKEQMENDPNAVVLDVRNRYETDAGKFENAIVCEIEHFRELPGYVEKLEALKGKHILMYCTGGVRCEKASALLRRRGFQHIHQLQGGIVSYQEEFGNEHWLGECFVFDQRMTVRVEQGLRQLGRCAHTGDATSRFVNCLHDPCHKLFLVSETAERANPDLRLCPECLATGLTSETADYRQPAAL